MRTSVAGVMRSVATFPLPAPDGGNNLLVVWEPGSVLRVVFGVTQAGVRYRSFKYDGSVRLALGRRLAREGNGDAARNHG